MFAAMIGSIVFREALSRTLLSHQVSGSLNHAEHDGFSVCAAATATRTYVTRLAAHIGLISLNVAVKFVAAVNLAHVLANFVAHAPRGLVRYAKLPLQFFGGNAVPSRGEQIDRVEPHLQRRPGVLKGRTGHWGDVMAAELAGIGRAFLDAVEGRFLATFRAIQRFAISDFHDMLQTGFLVRVFLEKVQYSQCLSHVFPPNVRQLWHGHLLEARGYIRSRILFCRSGPNRGQNCPRVTR